MFRCEFLATPECILFGGDDRETVAQGRDRRLGGGEIGKLAGQFLFNALDERGVGGDQDRQGDRIVLGLGQQVRRDKGRVARFVGKNGQLRRTGQQVDPDDSGEQELCGGHPLVPRPHHHITPGHRRRPVRHGGNGLRPPHRQQPPHPRHRPRGHHFAGRVRRGQPDLVDTRHPGRHGRHEHRRRQGKAPPRRVAPGHPDGHQTVAGPAPLHHHVHRSRRLQLGAGEVLDPAGGALQHLAIGPG